MEKVDITFQEFLHKVPAFIAGTPLLLTSVDGQGRPNIMTVGATSIGARPYHYVCEYIRPSCYTTKLIEETGDYTLNMPSEEMKEIFDYCGSVSGRNHDKFKELNLTAVPSREVNSPIIEECKFHLECRVSAIFYPIPESVAAGAKAYYEKTNVPSENYHRIYMAEIVSIYADKGVVEVNKNKNARR